MRLSQFIVSAVMMAWSCRSTSFQVSAQPMTKHDDHTSVPSESKDVPGRAPQHIYRWHAVPEPEKREIWNGDVAAFTKRHIHEDRRMASLMEAEGPAAGTNQLRRVRRDGQNWEGTRGRPQRLLFDGTDGDAGVSWAYGDGVGRWQEIKNEEHAVTEHPYYE